MCDDGTIPSVVDGPDDPVIRFTDNTPELNEDPTNDPTNSNVDAFDGPTNINSNDEEGAPNYIVKVTTPEDQEITPMILSTTELTNVEKIIITPVGQDPQEEVSEQPEKLQIFICNSIYVFMSFSFHSWLVIRHHLISVTFQLNHLMN